MLLPTAFEVGFAAVVDPAGTLLAPVCTVLLLATVSEPLALVPVGTLSLVVAAPATVPVALELSTDVVEAACVIVKFPVAVFAAERGIVA